MDMVEKIEKHAYQMWLETDNYHKLDYWERVMSWCARQQARKISKNVDILGQLIREYA